MFKHITFLILLLLLAADKVFADDIDGLIQMLKSGNNLSRIEASEKLVKLGSSIDSRIIKLLGEVDGKAKASVIWILGEWERKKYLLHLIPLLDSSYVTSRAAIVAMGKIGDPLVIPYLVDKLLAKNRYIRTDTVYALGRIGDKKAISHIIGVKEDHDWHVREAVAVALGQLGSSKVVEHLKKMAEEDADALVRIAAEESLKSLGLVLQ